MGNPLQRDVSCAAEHRRTPSIGLLGLLAGCVFGTACGEATKRDNETVRTSSDAGLRRASSDAGTRAKAGDPASAQALRDAGNRVGQPMADASARSDAGYGPDCAVRHDASHASEAGGMPDAGVGAPAWALPGVPVVERTFVTSERIANREASVPPQCYTKTEQRHNPCYVCHQMYDRRGAARLNELDDGALQGGYAFSDLGVHNHWTNLFVARKHWVDDIEDAQIRAYVDAGNYAALAERLGQAGFKGFIPDLSDYEEGASAFDARGLARDGSHWVAYNYKPFPGTFWPTNGAMDDVVVRLPRAFRERDGRFQRDVYYVNLTLVELTIKQLARAPSWQLDERAIGSDIDGDGQLGMANSVELREHYVGDAADTLVAFQQYPMGAELMHSVRYLGVDDAGKIHPPRRMKELRYMRKVSVLDRGTMSGRYANERKEKRLGELPNFLYRGDEGFDNALGWYIQGFVEDAEGELRPQSYEEGMFCMGCHSSIGTTIDSTFSLARKVTGGAGFGYINLVGMRDAPSMSEPGGEILNYLRRAGGGSEFRENPEMATRWFKSDGSVDVDRVSAADVYTLLTPSAARALMLNKAYTHIVRHQSYITGRDPTVAPAKNVYRDVDETTPPLEGPYRFYGWDLRLDWSVDSESLIATQ